MVNLIPKTADNLIWGRARSPRRLTLLRCNRGATLRHIRDYTWLRRNSPPVRRNCLKSSENTLGDP